MSKKCFYSGELVTELNWFRELFFNENREIAMDMDSKMNGSMPFDIVCPCGKTVKSKVAGNNWRVARHNRADK